MPYRRTTIIPLAIPTSSHELTLTSIGHSSLPAQYAGSFYQAMGNAGLAADPNNKRRILAAFPEMVATYGTASRLHQTMRAGVAA
jgi:hypothetical protein